eukprot:758133-Hanusia_phi.AAC.5
MGRVPAQGVVEGKGPLGCSLGDVECPTTPPPPSNYPTWEDSSEAAIYHPVPSNPTLLMMSHNPHLPLQFLPITHAIRSFTLPDLR